MDICVWSKAWFELYITEVLNCNNAKDKTPALKTTCFFRTLTLIHCILAKNQVFPVHTQLFRSMKYPPVDQANKKHLLFFNHFVSLCCPRHLICCVIEKQASAPFLLGKQKAAGTMVAELASSWRQVRRTTAAGDSCSHSNALATLSQHLCKHQKWTWCCQWRWRLELQIENPKSRKKYITPSVEA